MGIKKGSFFGNVRGGFKLGKSKPKVQGRFIRKKVNANKNVKFAKKFFKKSARVQRRYIRKKASLLKRVAAEKALEGGRAVIEGAKKSMKKKGGLFNPLKFVMMIFAGWLINQLPKLIEGIRKFIEWAKPAFEMLGKWVKGIVDFFKWIGGGVAKLWNAITGSSDSMEAEKKALKGKTDELEGTFKKQKEGFKDLEKKAKKEEGEIKKDLDDVDKEVKDEVAGEEGDKKTSTTSEGKTVASTTGAGSQSNLVKATSTPKNKLASKPRRIGTGKPVTVVIKGETVVLQPGTPEYNTFFAPGGAKDKIIQNKVKDVNIVKTSSGPKIVTVDMPLPSSSKSSQNNTVQMPVNQGSSDSVNSKEIALHGIDR
jgi:hypothetical protein